MADRYPNRSPSVPLLKRDAVGKASLQGIGRGISRVAFTNQIGITLNRNEFVCVVGASGCGKSTLLNLIAGPEAPTSGEILLEGEPIEEPGANRGMVFKTR